MAKNAYVKPLKFFKKNWIQCLCLLVISFALYFQSINQDYILDDKIVLSENTYVKNGLKGIPDILKYDSFYGYFQEKVDVLEGGRYRPLSLVTFAIEYEFFGLNPVISHIVNLFLYGLLAIAIYLLFTWFQQRFRLKESAWISFALMGAALFLFHPIHTESVINIKSRDEIMALLLALWAMIGFVYAEFLVQQRKWIWYFLAATSYFLALLAKENAITFLAVIPFTLYYLQQKKDFKQLISPTLVLVLFSGVYLYLRHVVIGTTVTSGQVENPLNNPFFGMSTTQEWGTILYTLERYVELLILPINLSHDYYPYAVPIADFSYSRVWLAVLLYLAMGIMAGYGIFKKSILSWAAFYYLVTISVVSNVFLVIGTTMNERFIFMSSLAFSLVTAYLLYRLRKRARYVGLTVFVAIIAFYAYQTSIRIPDWASYINLNKSAVENAPNSARSHLFYGTALFKEAQNIGDFQQKVQNYQEALDNFTAAQDVFIQKGTSTTKHYKYFDAINMRAGAAAELYKLNALTINELLQEFKQVLMNNPRNNYTYQFLQYLNRGNSNRQELAQFYVDVVQSIMLPYGQQVNPSFYETALKYINLGLQVEPGNAYLTRAQVDVAQLLGRN